jgi:exopolysaccharide biosynthesis WecB/TagA/CpsF family protein
MIGYAPAHAMKVLLVHNRYQQSGGEDTVFAAEKTLLESNGHDVSTLQSSNQEITSLAAQCKAGLTAVYSMPARRMLGAEIARQQPDVVHVHNFFPLLSPSIYDACRNAGVPVVQTLHNYRLLCPSALLFRDGHVCEDCLGKVVPWPGVAHACYRHSRPGSASVAAMIAVHRWRRTWTEKVDVYIALTEFARDKFVSGGLPAEHIVVKPNFVHPAPAHGSGQGGYALFVGQLTEEKGIHTLLAAWEQHPVDLPLKIAGDGPLAAEVRQAAQRNSRIEWLGGVPHDRVLALMQQAGALVFPSTCYETFGMSIIEAFAVGLPVIASNLGCLPTLVRHGRTGLHFRAGDADDLVRQTAWIGAHPAEWQQMRDNARAEFERLYSGPANYRQLMEIYARGIEQAAARSRPRMAAIAAAPDFMDKPRHAIARYNVLGVHGVSEAQNNHEFRRILNQAFLNTPDGMPLVWVGKCQGLGCVDRVYGPDLMLETFGATQHTPFTHFFYGGAPGVAEELKTRFERQFPGVKIVGTFAPPFRALTPEEEDQFVAAVRRSKPDIIWVGLSTPKQEAFMAHYLPRLDVRLLFGVGAAFDFHTGRVCQAPRWIQRSGFEWFYRLCHEPRRLWKRYLKNNPLFLLRLFAQATGLKKYRLD